MTVVTLPIPGGGFVTYDDASPPQAGPPGTLYGKPVTAVPLADLREAAAMARNLSSPVAPGMTAAISPAAFTRMAYGDAEIARIRRLRDRARKGSLRHG